MSTMCLLFENRMPLRHRRYRRHHPNPLQLQRHRRISRRNSKCRTKSDAYAHTHTLHPLQNPRRRLLLSPKVHPNQCRGPSLPLSLRPDRPVRRVVNATATLGSPKGSPTGAASGTGNGGPSRSHLGQLCLPVPQEAATAALFWPRRSRPSIRRKCHLTGAPDSFGEPFPPISSDYRPNAGGSFACPGPWSTLGADYK